jgi:hypothetical protein
LTTLTVEVTIRLFTDQALLLVALHRVLRSVTLLLAAQDEAAVRKFEVR